MWKSIYTPPSSPPSLEEMEAQQHTPVESLRIRTPDFSTHEEADYAYYKRRGERARSRRVWKRVYTGSVFVASWVGARSFCMNQNPLNAESFILITLVSAAFTVGCIMSYRICKGVVEGGRRAIEPAAAYEKSEYEAEELDAAL